MVFVKNLTLKQAKDINMKYPRLAILLYSLKEKGCGKCKFKPKTYDEFEFHYYTTHGIPREILVMWLMNEIK